MVVQVDVPSMNYLMIDGEGDPNTSRAWKTIIRQVAFAFGAPPGARGQRLEADGQRGQDGGQLPVMPVPHFTFYPKWIAANGWAEAVGLGTTMVLGRAVAPALERHTGLAAVLLAAVAAVILGILLEGALVGSAQAWVLRAALRGLSAASWIKATMIGAGIAWLLGTVPSTVAALMASASSSGAAPTSEPSAAVQYGLAALLGAVTGPVLGLAQWLVLRRHVARAGRWILANAVAWALGMVVIFLGMDQVPWRRGGLGVVVGVYLVCGGAGLVVGAIHGWVLRDLVGGANTAPAAG